MLNSDWGISLRWDSGDTPMQDLQGLGDTKNSRGCHLHIGRIDILDRSPAEAADRARRLVNKLEAMGLAGRKIADKTIFALPQTDPHVAMVPPVALGIGPRGEAWIYDGVPRRPADGGAPRLAEAIGLRFTAPDANVDEGPPFYRGRGWLDPFERQVNVGLVIDSGRAIFTSFDDIYVGQGTSRLVKDASTLKQIGWQQDLVNRGFRALSPPLSGTQAFSYHGDSRHLKGILVTSTQGVLSEVWVPRAQPYQGRVCSDVADDLSPDSLEKGCYEGLRLSFSDGSRAHLRPPVKVYPNSTWRVAYNSVWHWQLTRNHIMRPFGGASTLS